MKKIGTLRKEKERGNQMFLVGVIADKKTQKMLQQHNSQVEMISVRPETMKNMRNVMFDTIIIDEEIENMEDLEPYLQKTEYIVLNTDRKHSIPRIQNEKASLITYGFNSKSTITASSIMEEKILICLQRNVKSKHGDSIEPQEFWVEANPGADVYEMMAKTCMDMIYGKQKNRKNEK